MWLRANQGETRPALVPLAIPWTYQTWIHSRGSSGGVGPGSRAVWSPRAEPEPRNRPGQPADTAENTDSQVVPPRPQQPDDNERREKKICADRPIGHPSAYRTALFLYLKLLRYLVLLVRHCRSPVTGVSCIPRRPASAKAPLVRDSQRSSRRRPISPSEIPAGSELRYRRCWSDIGADRGSSIFDSEG